MLAKGIVSFKGISGFGVGVLGSGHQALANLWLRRNVLLVVIPGTARIIQLRITARRHRRLDTKRPASPAATPPAGHNHHPAPADPASPAGM